jgi:nitrate reductase gamma subunit
MSMFTLLKVGVAVSGLFCIVTLTVILIRTFSFGQKPTYAHPRGSSFSGVVYALGWGMLPWEKESASQHLWTYAGGILYHLGILVTLLFLSTVLLGISLPATFLLIERILLTIGLISGVTLLIKRVSKPSMRALSSGDDYWANVLVDLLLLSALASTFTEKALIPFLIIAIVTFIYLPFGKLRHCVFFFYSRILFGDFFGRRGILPHPSRKT